MNSRIKESAIVFFIVVLSRLPQLGHDIFNTDVWKWKARIFDFGSGVFYMEFAKTLQRYHPGVGLMWLGTLGVKLHTLYYKFVYGIMPPDNSLDTIFNLHFFQKLVIVLAIAFVLSMCYYILSVILSPLYARFVILFLIFEPFYIALTRVVHLEGLLATFMFASFLLVYWYTVDDKAKIFKLPVLYVAAIFTGYSVLIKTPALLLLPLTGLILFYSRYTLTRNFVSSLKHSLHNYLLWLLVVCLTIFILWPALWVIPAEVYSTLYRGIFSVGVDEGHAQFYFNKYVEDPGFSFYFVVIALRSSPYLLLGLVGYILVRYNLCICRLWDKRKTLNNHIPSKVTNFVFYVFVFSILYMLEVTLPSKKLDRYLLPSIVGFSVISSVFFAWCFETYMKANKKLYATFSILLVLWLGYIGSLTPDYFSYYNPMFGGLSKGIYIIEPKWLIGQFELLDKLDEVALEQNLLEFTLDESFENSKDLTNKFSVGFPEKYYTQIWPLVKDIGGWAIIEDLGPQARKTNLFVYPVWDDYSAEETRFRLEYVTTSYTQGVALYNIYRRVP